MKSLIKWLISLFFKPKKDDIKDIPPETKTHLKIVKPQKAVKAQKEPDPKELLRKRFPFDLSLYTKSTTAARLGIHNQPKDIKEILALRDVHEHIVLPCYLEFAIKQGKHFSLNSGYRCLTLNRALGSEDTSQHIKGQAVDIEFIGISNDFLAEWIFHNLTFDQLIKEMIEDYDPQAGWVHCSYVSDDRNRNIMGQIKKGGKYQHLKTKKIH